MKICPRCGKESESKFCPECGYDLTNITEETVNVIENAIDADVEIINEDTGSSEAESPAEPSIGNTETATIPSELNVNTQPPLQNEQPKKKSKIKKIVLIVVAVIVALFIIILAIPCSHEWAAATCENPKTCNICGETEGSALGHTDGEWILTEEATLVDVGVEELICTRCNESLDSRGTERKNAKVTGKTFNFTDEELIEWIEDFSTAEIDSEELDLLEGNNTSYRVTTTDGDVGALLLNHSHGDEISGIMVYFEEYETASALAVLIG